MASAMIEDGYLHKRLGVLCAAASILTVIAMTPMTGVAAEPTMEQLLQKLEDRDRKLEQRDAVIRDLLSRVEELERRTDAAAEQRDRPPQPGAAAAVAAPVEQPPAAVAPVQPAETAEAAPAVAVAPAPAAVDRQDQTGAPADAASEQKDQPVAPDTPESEQKTAGSAPQPSEPGRLEVDEDAAERALERTLVQTGAVLLPFGQAEVTPNFSYVRRESDSQLFAQLATFFGPQVVVGGETDARRDELTPSVDFRLGLPFESQIELAVPWNIVGQSTVTTFGGQRTETDGWGNGIGDLQLGLAKTLLLEGQFAEWVPDIVARFTWDSKTGENFDNDIPLGSGFNSVRGALSATKRLDPLAFFGSFFYESSFEDNGVTPGDQFGFNLAALLAASPETSLSLGLSQSFTNDVKVDGNFINGTDAVQASLNAGVSVILGRNVLLNLNAGVGLTDESPDYSVGISLPIRFNLPVP